MADTKDMTLGMWIDFVIEDNAMREETEDNADNGVKRFDSTNHMATQADFDAF